MDKIITIYNKNRKLVFFFSAFLFFFILQRQYYYYVPTHGYDPSWRTAHGLVNASDSLFYGKDFAFTCGPLYYLVYNFLASNSAVANFIQLLVLNIVFALLRVVIAYKIHFSIKSETNAIKFAKYTAIILVVLAYSHYWILDYMVTLAFFLFYDMLLLLRDKRFDTRAFLMTAFPSLVLLAIIPISKFSYFSITALVSLCLIGVFVFHKKIWFALATPAVLCICTIVTWLLCGQKLEYLLSYFNYGMQTVMGYTDAMATNILFLYLHNLLFGLGFCCLCLIGWIITVRSDKYKGFALLIGASLLFLFWKESFVRADEHTYSINPGALFALIYIIYVFGKERINKGVLLKPYIMYIANTLLGVFVLIFISIYGVKLVTYDKIFDTAYFLYKPRVMLANYKAILLENYTWFEPLRDEISESDTVDIFPWEFSLLYAYDLNYNPHVGVNTNSNYTEVLDRSSAADFFGESAPDKIIMMYPEINIDHRYLVFDEPQTFRTLLSNYSVINDESDEALILEHTADSVLEPKIMSSTTGKLGENIYVPFSDNGYVYMSVNTKLTLLGNLASFIYKIPHDSISITTADGEVHTHPFIRQVANNGLYVTSYVSDLNDLQNVFSGEAVHNIESIRIDGNPLFYNSEFDVTFFSVEVPSK